MKDVREVLAERAAGHGDLSPLAATFLRGLSLGALVGAAIAGSAIWRRLREARDEPVDRRSAKDLTEPEDPA